MARQFSDLGTVLSQLEVGEAPRALPVAEMAKKKELVPTPSPLPQGVGHRKDIGGQATSGSRREIVENHPSEESMAALRSQSSLRLAMPPAAGGTQAPPQEGSRDDWDRAARDPLVQRVKEAVEGTLFDVQSVAAVRIEAPTPVDAESAERGLAPEVMMPEDEGLT